MKYSVLFELIFQGLDTYASMHLKAVNVTHNMLCSIKDIALYILKLTVPTNLINLVHCVGHGVPGVVAWSCSEITLGASVNINPHSL